jgi:hypothetical protein
VSCAGFTLLLRTVPYSAKCGISASCCTYADCVSAAVGGGGDAEALVAGAAIVSSVLGPENASEFRIRENKNTDGSTQQQVELD